MEQYFYKNNPIVIFNQKKTPNIKISGDSSNYNENTSLHFINRTNTYSVPCWFRENISYPMTDGTDSI